MVKNTVTSGGLGKSINKGGLGRGVDYLLGGGSKEIITETSKADIINIPMYRLRAGQHQPRKRFNEESLDELTASIKNQGIIQPIIVRIIKESANSSEIEYEIIAGERRFRAAKLANINEIPAIVRDYSDNEAMTIALIDNLQREDLNAIEEAEAYYSLKEVHGLSQEALAEKLGKSRSAVANSLRLLSLPYFIRESIIRNELSASHGRSLLPLEDENLQKIVFQAITNKNLNVREIEKIVDTWKKTGKLPASLTQKNDQNANSKTKEDISEVIQNIDVKLKDKFYKKASIRGDEHKGSIKIRYKNQEELQYILDILSIEHGIHN